MSAVPESSPGSSSRSAAGARGERPRERPAAGAKIYLTVLALVTLAAAGKFYLGAPNVRHGWVTFVMLAVPATLAHPFPVKSPRNQMYHTSVVFLVAAALLLPPELIVLIPLVQTVPEWLKVRYPWPIQGFNISNYTCDSFAAWGVARSGQASRRGRRGPRRAAVAASPPRSASRREPRARRDHAELGAATASRDSACSPSSRSRSTSCSTFSALVAASGLNPWLVPPSLAPLLLVRRSLSVPRSRRRRA